LARHEKSVSSDNRLLLRKADAMVAYGKPAEALEILMHNKFPLCEGKILPRLLFEDACWQMSEYCKSKGTIEEALSYLMKPLEYPENLGVGKPAANMETEWYWRCGKLCQEKGDGDQALEFYKKGTEGGSAIPINFFPLKNLVWQHDSEMIELPVWLNILFRGACFKELGQIQEYRKLYTQIKGFLDTKKQEQRTDEPEVIVLNNLIHTLEGNQSKTTSNVPGTISYFRLLQTVF
jgi:tetratricopeptide (TPR) repeat protein